MRYLDALDDQDRQDFAARAVERQFARGAPLFHERQVGERVLLLLEGRVKLTTTTPAGREVLLAVRGPGALLGELSALDRQPRSAGAFALDAVRALALPTDDFREFLRQRPNAALALLEMLAERLRDADRQRAGFLAQDSTGRLAARLVELAEAYGVPEGDAIRIDLPISQEELAGWIGSSREAVAKSIAALRGLGWIETGRRAIRVCDVDALRRRSA